MKRIGCLTAVLAVVGCMLTGCGTFDAAGYTKAVLDAGYKNESQEYQKLTNQTEEEASKLYQANLETNMEAFNDTGISDDMKAKYSALMEQMMKGAKYEVGEATQDADKNFTVPVTVYPMNLLEAANEELTTKSEEYLSKLTEDAMNGAATPSQEEINEQVYSMLYDVLSSHMDNLQYGDPQEITIHVTKDDNNTYNISPEELTNLDNALFNSNESTTE